MIKDNEELEKGYTDKHKKLTAQQKKYLEMMKERMKRKIEKKIHNEKKSETSFSSAGEVPEKKIHPKSPAINKYIRESIKGYKSQNMETNIVGTNPKSFMNIQTT